MAHEIESQDTMFSVRERPWHGLGTILEEYPTIEEAQVASGLDFTVEKRPVMFTADEFSTEPLEMPGQFVTVRTDSNTPLGVVGSTYEVYQNEQMWQFMETFLARSGGQLETAGSLRNGRIVWTLVKASEIEYVSGDPIGEFFLFRNSFDGSCHIESLFTDIRVVCNNTLQAALKGAKDRFQVRHTTNANENMALTEKALGIRQKYNEVKNAAFHTLAKHQMNEGSMRNFIDDLLAPAGKKPSNIITPEMLRKEAAQPGKIDWAAKNREKNRDDIMALVEAGAGADIPGVRGTAYGLLNAVTEWTDHEKGIRVTKGTDESEARFVNAMWGTGAKFKQKAFNRLLAAA